MINIRAALVACVFIYVQAGAAILFQDDFESDSSLFFWQHHGEDSARITRDRPFSGNGAAELALRTGNYLYREVLLHKSDTLTAHGFYTRFYFTIIPLPSFDSAQSSRGSANIFSYELLTFREAGCLNPWIYSMGVVDGKYSLAIGVRDRVAGNAYVFPRGEPRMLVAPGTWHCLELFLSLHNDAVHDSLFLDGTFITAQTMPFRERAESFKGLILGSSSVSQNSGIGSIRYDDLVVSSQRIGPKPAIPVIIHPQQGESCLRPSPVFTWTADSFTDSVAFEVFSTTGVRVRDSLFYCHDTIRFSTPFEPNQSYSVRARVKNIFGTWGPWNNNHSFFISRTPVFSQPDPGFRVSMSPSPHDSLNPLFYYADTIRYSITLPADSLDIMYMVLNVSHESFASQWDKRWKIFDPAQNWLFNISLREQKVLYLLSGGTWAPFSTIASSGKTRDMPLVWDQTTFTDSAIVFTFVFKKINTPGIWHISTQFIERGGKTDYTTPLFLLLEKKPVPEWMKISAAVLGLLLFGVILIRYFRKKQAAAALKTPAMVEIARAITRFLEEHYREKLSNDEIGQVVGLSGHRAVSIYKTVTGETPFSKVTSIRIEKAKDLLEAGVKSVSEIAYETGFSDLRLFQRNFKKLTSMTPTEFREKK